MERTSYSILNNEINQQVLVNNQPAKIYYVTCSCCNRLLEQFNPGVALCAITDYIKNNLAKNIIYCPTCGCKINYQNDIIDTEAKIITVDSD